MSVNTPIIRRIPEQNGSFYTFSSAAKELSLNVGEHTTAKKFRFSKFALLNIPDFNERGVLKNTIKFYATQSGARSPLSVESSSAAQWFAESFQNYCLNMEAQVMSSENFSLAPDTTISERLFFKWLKELTAVRFRPAVDRNGVIIPNYYMEETESANYKRVVQYVGNTAPTNAFESNDTNYTEVYLHVPTLHGRPPAILFKSVSDENYSPGAMFFRNDLNRSLISGKTFADPSHPDGLSIAAMYDSTFRGTSDPDIPGFALLQLYKKITPGPFGAEPIAVGGNTNTDHYTDTSPNNWWFNTNAVEPYAYLSEPTRFDDPTNDYFAIYSDRNSGFGTDVNDPLSGALRFVRSRLDGITIEKTIDAYQNIVPGVTSFSEMNSEINTDSFEFNACLLYYDIFSNNPSTGAETVHATNLFGVYFIDRPVQPNLNNASYIPRFVKNRPNALSRQNGNAYSIKFNLKISNAAAPTDLRVIDPYLNNGVEVEVDTGYTFSMDLFADAMDQMKKMTQALLDVSTGNSLDSDRISMLSSLVNKLNMPLDSITQRLTAIEQIIQSNEFVLSADNSTQIGRLIVKLSDDLKKILRGEIPADLTFDLSAFQEGYGVKIEKSPETRTAVFGLQSNSYNLSDNFISKFPFDWDDSGQFYNYTFPLEKMTNYNRIESISAADYLKNSTLQSSYPKKNFRIFIDDTEERWQRGQLFKLYFSNELLFLNPIVSAETLEVSTGSTIEIFTDARNRLRNPQRYSKRIASLSNADFTPGILSKRYIEIICTNPDTFEFIVDIPN